MSSNGVVSLAPWLDTSELRELMLLLIGWRGEPERHRVAVEEAIDRYARQANLFPYGVVCEGKLAGMIGIEANNKRGIIHHIVVAPLWRRCGIGRLMIDKPLFPFVSRFWKPKPTPAPSTFMQSAVS